MEKSEAAARKEIRALRTELKILSRARRFAHCTLSRARLTRMRVEHLFERRADVEAGPADHAPRHGEEQRRSSEERAREGITGACTPHASIEV